MAIAPLSLREGYWENLTIQEEDLEFLYNYLLEIETPQTPQELAQVLIKDRIRKETDVLQKQQKEGSDVFLPKNHYQKGQVLSFPAMNWQKGEVVAVREGRNPEYEPFEVIQVKLSTGDTKEFASGLGSHKLNEPIRVNLDDPALNLNSVQKTYGKSISQQITEVFESRDDLVRIAGRWFPRALLVDVNIGYLNLAEAVLEMENGGPLTTAQILEQIELPTDVNPKLTEFSLNLALEEDERFDEVGPAGEVMWFLHRLEPEGVKNPPIFLKSQVMDVDPNVLGPALAEFEALVHDELEVTEKPNLEQGEITISLIYPHWRAGSLPLSPQIAQLFPTAYESPRVQFTFIDVETGEKFSGWVIRKNKYVFGLRDWYEAKDLVPGGLIKIRRSENAGEVFIQAMKKRPTKEWVRTVLVGNDGGVVFAMLKQQISNLYDDRMVVAIPDVDLLDKVWEQPGRRTPIEQSIFNVMRELTKLNPQGQVHAQELYAAVNVVRRCPPALVLYSLVQNPKAVHLGDLYFRLDESRQGEIAHE